MSNKEHLLSLVRQRYAETVAWSYRLEYLHSCMETARKEPREYKPLWDQAEAELAADERATQEYARQSQPYVTLSIDEFSNEEQEEITVLLKTGVELVRRLREKFDQVRHAQR
jgi:hypothetical protein